MDKAKAFKIFEAYYGSSATEAKDALKIKIKKHDYANDNSDYGWNIEHVLPKAKGGTNHYFNLAPLSYKANRYKGSKIKNMEFVDGRKISVLLQVTKQGIKYGVFKIDNNLRFSNQKQITKKLKDLTRNKY